MKTFFAIYLVEDESGRVTVKSDHYGPGFNSYHLGIEILENLKALEVTEHDFLNVQHLTYSPCVH